MRIVVCIKQVGYVYHPTAVDLVTGDIDPEKMVFMLNPFDEVAVEEAIKIKEDFSNCEVIVITAGPPEADEALKYAYAMGCDRMIRINLEGFDPWTTSQALSKTIEKLEFDLILCGKKAIDNDCGQVGIFIAEFLDLPQASGIVGLNLLPHENKAVVQRYLGKGDREELECILPALFTVEKGLNDPRYPTLPNRLLAEKADIEVIDPVSQGLRLDEEETLTQIVDTGPPRPKTRKVFIPDSNLSAADKLNLMMAGGAAKKEGNDFLEGPDDQLADKIVEFLIKNNVIKEADDKPM